MTDTNKSETFTREEAVALAKQVGLLPANELDGTIVPYIHALCNAAAQAAREKQEPVAYLETITGQVRLPNEEHRVRFPNAYVPLYTSPPVQAPLSSNNHGLDTDQRVCFYEQDFYVLSNFSAFNLRRNGWVFQTSEHAYHYEKFDPRTRAIGDGTYVRDAILDAPSAHEAFKIAERHKSLRRRDWDGVKVGIMRDILRAKANQHEYVRRKLLATGDRELVENSWRDSYWGWGPNRDGKNMLGKLWMEVRAELRALGIKGEGS